MYFSYARGDHLLLLLEDVPGLKKLVYAKVTRVTGASATVIDVDNSKRKWKVPTDVVVARHVKEAVATGPQPGLWLRQVRMRIPDPIQVDPIIALLLWDHYASTRLSCPRPSRDTDVLLHNLLPVADIPDGSIARSWIDPHDGSERVFPLQHAIDYVHVTDSVARRVPKSVRDAVGELFCRPPVTTRSPVVAAAAVPTRRSHAKRSLPSKDSFFNSSSPASSEVDPDLNARITGKLTDDSVLLAHFLQVVTPTDTHLSSSSAAEPAIRHPKRYRVNSYGSSPEKVKPSKYTFQPDRQRVRVRRLTRPPSLAGTSPSIS
ncbi:uncharacterized protein IUM83_11837 [Phytophthora cinnamomi]|uniref:uncharacterized protein n=1 Tax=Phytophthora cinnamomi TaxID=4785 RepID=UPI00355947E8|nr:hypothetical protein IUM83_11837 [Phytophthora cinnamomi]